jgi:hypothetical protein
MFFVIGSNVLHDRRTIRSSSTQIQCIYCIMRVHISACMIGWANAIRPTLHHNECSPLISRPPSMIVSNLLVFKQSWKPIKLSLLVMCQLPTLIAYTDVYLTGATHGTHPHQDVIIPNILI